MVGPFIVIKLSVSVLRVIEIISVESAALGLMKLINPALRTAAAPVQPRRERIRASRQLRGGFGNWKTCSRFPQHHSFAQLAIIRDT